MRLPASGVVQALLGLPGGGIATGTNAGILDLLPDAAAVRSVSAAPMRLRASGAVLALLGLPGGGIPAGPNAGPSGRPKAGGPMLRLSRIESGRNLARKPDFRPGITDA